jgi:ATP-dependent Clp protease ATP-binding subunit ClpA
VFERFTAPARDVVVEAKAASRRFGHGHVGCEHLLLALSASSDPAGEVLRSSGVSPERVQSGIEELVGSGPGDEREALAALGIDLDAVRQTVEATFGPGALDRPPPRHRSWRPRLRRRRESCGHRVRPGHTPFTPRAKRCLERSLREAIRLGHHHIGAEHIGLALTAADDTMAAAVLVRLGVRPGQLRTQLLDSLRRSA